MSKKLSIIDYKINNLESIKNALSYLKYNPVITNDYKEILNSDGLILPGVGSYPEAMKQINNLNLGQAISDFIDTKKPFLGICLGFQLLFSYSTEFKYTSGLNILKGKCESFSKLETINKTPHVGWNKLILNENCKVLEKKLNLNFNLNNSFYYFVHSFYVTPENNDVILSFTDYMDHRFCSSIKKNNIVATQFHPEKSGQTGLNFLKCIFN